jgi:ABC-type antimicrobial peptide transport system ATPase subunit
MWKLGESWRKRRMIEVVEKVGIRGKVEIMEKGGY